MNISKKIGIWAIVAGLAALLPSFTQAQTITWGSGQQITGDADVSTSGTAVDAIQAYASGGSAITLDNGVVFNAATVTGGGQLEDASADIVIGSNLADTYFGAAGIVGSGDANYDQLLDGLSVGTGGATNMITFNNLTPDTQYQVEVWTNYINQPTDGINLAGGPVTAGPYASGSSTGAVGLTSSVSDGAGSFVIGTFTATGTSFVLDYEDGYGYGGTTYVQGQEPLDLNGGYPGQDVNYYGQSIVNAIQIRSLAVPEPSAWALVLAGVGGLFFLRGLRRKPSQS